MKDSSGNRPRKLLAIAYFFPPLFSVGGSIRVVKFLKYLPAHGWQASVLTVDDSQDFDKLRREGSEELLQDLPPDIQVHRTGSGEPSTAILQAGRAAREKSRLAKLIVNFLRAVRHFVTIWLMAPDENVIWLPKAVRKARQVIKNEQTSVIFVTCPPHSASLIGAALKRLTRKPLVLDFRDDWVDTPWYRERPAFTRFLNRLLERWVVGAADRLVLVTPVSHTAFTKRYPRWSHKFVLIPNGVDLVDYAILDSGVQPPAPDGKFTIVHAGLLTVASDWNRNPRPFFQALVDLRRQQPALGNNLRMVFTAALPDEYRAYVTEMGLQDVVQEVGYLPRPEFAKLLQSADLLLTVNYDGFATLVPGKIYEYWAVGGAPIMLLSQPGAAQQLVDQYKLGVALDPRDTPSMAKAIAEYYRQREVGTPVRISRDGIQNFDRAALAGKLAQVLDSVLKQ